MQSTTEQNKTDKSIPNGLILIRGRSLSFIWFEVVSWVFRTEKCLAFSAHYFLNPKPIP